MVNRTNTSAGGHARAKALSPEQRSQIARDAAAARWNTRKRRKRSAWAAFLVRLKVPPGATIGDVRHYIEEAVSTWRGSLRPPNAYGYEDDEPGDPLFELDVDSVKVRHIRKRGVR